MCTGLSTQKNKKKKRGKSNKIKRKTSDELNWVNYTLEQTIWIEHICLCTALPSDNKETIRCKLPMINQMRKEKTNKQTNIHSANFRKIKIDRIMKRINQML